MGFRTTGLLLVVVGVLVLLLMWTSKGPEEPASVSEPVLEGRRMSEALRILIQRGELQDIVLENRVDHFQMVEPVVDRASMAVLRSIAAAYDSALRFVAYTEEEVEAEPVLWTETGLRPPAARIRFEFPDADDIAVDLGDTGPLGQDLFLRMGSGDVIYRGGLDLLTVLDVNVDEMREHQVFRHTAGEVAGITVERALRDGGTETLELERRGREFRMLRPRVGRVDHVNLELFMREILGMRVEAFVPGVMRQPAEVPDLVLTVRGNGTEKVSLWYRENGSMLGTMEERGTSFSVSASDAPSFFETAVENLRAHLLISTDVQEVMNIRLDPGDGARAATLARTGNGFRLTEPVPSETDPTEVGRVLQGLRNLGVVEFVEGETTDQAFGLNSGYFTVTVRQQFDQEPVHVRLGRDEGDLTYARRDDEDQVVKISKEVADRLRRPWTVFVAGDVQRVNGPVNELRILRQGGREIGFQRGDDGAWRERGGTEPRPLLADFVEELVDLRADAVLDPQATQLDVEPYRLQLLRSGDRLGELRVYDRGDGVPLLVHNGRIDVLFQLSVRTSREIRELADQ